jgi:two-component system, LytTR family, sensor kinase
MNRSAAIRRHLTTWAFILGLWCLLVLAFAGQLVLTSRRDWTQALTASARDWFPWALLSPAVAWLALRFPLESRKLQLSIPIHLLACLLALVVCESLSPPLPSPRGPLRQGPPGEFRPGPPDEGPPFGPGPPDREGFPPDRPPMPLPEPRRGSFINSLLIRARVNVPIYWAIVSIVHALSYYRRSQDRERKSIELEARLTEARLHALRMQLHPHFLFNTLHAISTLVHKDPRAADEMIANLSELLRVTLDSSHQQEITLRKELEFLDRYLDIQQVRFGDRLRVEKEIDASALDGQVPTLVLQPLVENAIRHGIEPQPAPGLLSIRALREGEHLRITIHDNGTGVKKPAGQQDGIGLSNTRARLQELYGTSARLIISTASEGGCSVEVDIPYHEAASSALAAEVGTA